MYTVNVTILRDDIKLANPVVVSETFPIPTLAEAESLKEDLVDYVNGRFVNGNRHSIPTEQQLLKTLDKTHGEDELWDDFDGNRDIVLY